MLVKYLNDSIESLEKIVEDFDRKYKKETDKDLKNHFEKQWQYFKGKKNAYLQIANDLGITDLIECIKER